MQNLLRNCLGFEVVELEPVIVTTIEFIGLKPECQTAPRHSIRTIACVVILAHPRSVQELQHVVDGVGVLHMAAEWLFSSLCLACFVGFPPLCPTETL